MANVENPYQIALENNLIVTTYQQNKSAYTIRVKFGLNNYVSEAYDAIHGTTSSRPVSGEILYNDSPYELHLFGNFSYGSDYNFSIAIDPSIRNNAKPLIIRAKNSSSQENIENFGYFAIIDTNLTIYDENDTYIEFRYSYGALSDSHEIPYDYQTFLRTQADRDCKFDEGTIIEFELSDYNFYEDKSIPYYYLTNKIDSDIFIDFQQIEIENIVTTSSNDYTIINNMIAFPNISNLDDFITVIDGKQYIDISSFAFTWGGAAFLVDQNNIESITDIFKGITDESVIE